MNAEDKEEVQELIRDYESKSFTFSIKNHFDHGYGWVSPIYAKTLTWEIDGKVVKEKTIFAGEEKEDNKDSIKQ